jgi:hypothetical protein
MSSRKRVRTEINAKPEGPAKRRAVCSSPLQRSLSPPLLSLTQKNLKALTESQKSPSDPESCPVIANQTSCQPNDNLDTTLKLEAYKTFVDSNCPLPLPLAEHVKTAILAPRNPSILISPNAARLKKQRRAAAQQSKRNDIKQIEPHMLFRRETEDHSRVAAVP